MAAVAPEELLHLLGPFLPTDRFRALLQGVDLPAVAQGAALMVDISGFTPLTEQLVQQYGARQAGDELRRLLNRMFEATTGQVFQHGGSVIRLIGDGFMAWFDDSHPDARGNILAGSVRAVAAAVAMQELMDALFSDLDLRIGIGSGTADRWVVGQPRYGLSDVLSGPAVQKMIRAIEHALPGQIVIDHDLWALLDGRASMQYREATGEWVLFDLDVALKQSARQHRWPAWKSEIDSDQALDGVRQYVDLTLRGAIESGLGGFTSELRYACPMFIRINSTDNPNPDTRADLNQRVSLIQDVLTETGGRLVSVEISDKGSVVFAVFGAPITYGDDPQRALNAAFTLQKSALRLPDGHGMFQFGISRGLLYAGIVGGEVRHEYSTIGDETNIAARLMSAARPGQILITSHMREGLKDDVQWRELPPLAVKGRSQPVAISEALDTDPRPLPETFIASFVGRQAELDQFRHSLSAVERGTTRIVTIEGLMGMGKTRLVTEMQQHAEQGKFRVAQGHCLSTGRAMAYFPWCEILSTLLNLSSELPDAVNIERLSTFFSEVQPDWSWRLPLLAELVQLPLPAANSIASGLMGRSRQQALSTLVIDLLRHFTSQQPLLLSFEDVHWIDELSESLLLDLIRDTRGVPLPLCLIFSYRPLSGERGGASLSAALADQDGYTALSLTELTAPEVEAMIGQRFNALPTAELSRFVVERSGGNPFLVHEVLDVLHETDKLYFYRGHVSLSQASIAINMPSTAQELVQGRIDRLDDTDKLILKVASIIGRQFSMNVLENSLPYAIPHAELLERLAVLETQHFSQRELDETELVYRFDHAIIQDVVYQSLPFEQREQIHQMVGTTLRRIAPDQIEQLAYHFVRSNREYRGLARQYLIAAAKKAIAEYANQSALIYLEQAIVLAEELTEQITLRCMRLDVLLRVGQLASVEAEIDHLYELVRQTPPSNREAEIGLRRAQYLLQIGSWERAIVEGEQAWTATVSASHDALAWEIGLLLLSLYRTVEDRAAMERLLPEMNAIVTRLDDPRKHIQLALQELSQLYIERPVEAFAGAEAVLAEAQALGDAELETACWSLIATIHNFKHNYPAAIAALDKELALYRRIGSRHAEGNVLHTLSWTLILLGQFSQASDLLGQSYTIMRQLGEPYGEAASLTGLGVIAWLRFAYDEALAYLNRSMVLLSEHQAEAEIGVVWFHIGNVRLSKGEIHSAKQAFHEAIDRLKVKGRLTYVAAAEAGLAELSLYQGDLYHAALSIQPITDRLLNGDVSRFQQPGLAYWRAIMINQALGKADIVARLSDKAREYHDYVLSTLSGPVERTMFADHLWYNKR